jgi:hypothetical protein
MSLLPLADYSDDDDGDEPVAQIAAQPAVPPRVNRDSPGPLTPSRDNAASKKPASGLVKLRHSEGQRGTTPTLESAVTPSAASEVSSDRAPSPSFREPARDAEESMSEQGESKRNEILRPSELIELPGEPEGSVDPQLQVRPLSGHVFRWLTPLLLSHTSFPVAHPTCTHIPGQNGKVDGASSERHVVQWGSDEQQGLQKSQHHEQTHRVPRTGRIRVQLRQG